MELQGSVREAGLADKEAVLAINDVYDGFDYLWDYFDHFIEDPCITPYVYELGGEIKIHAYDLDPQRDLLKHQIEATPTRHTLRQLSHAELSSIIGNDRVTQVLFPDKRAIVDCVPFRILPANVPLMFGKDVTFVAGMDTNSVEFRSACSVARLQESPYSHSWTIDLFGAGFRSDLVAAHLAMHFRDICQTCATVTRLWIHTSSDFSEDNMDAVLSKFGIERKSSAFSFTALYECELQQ